jgi:hypothetical protein
MTTNTHPVKELEMLAGVPVRTLRRWIEQAANSLDAERVEAARRQRVPPDSVGLSEFSPSFSWGSDTGYSFPRSDW